MQVLAYLQTFISYKNRLVHLLSLSNSIITNLAKEEKKKSTVLQRTLHSSHPLHILPSLHYLDPLEDFCFCLFSWTAVVCIADLSMRRKGRERKWWGVREGEGTEKEGEGGAGEGKGRRKEGGGRKRLGERVMYWIISYVFNTWTLPLHPPSLAFSWRRWFLCLLGSNWACSALWTSCIHY